MSEEAQPRRVRSGGVTPVFRWKLPRVLAWLVQLCCLYFFSWFASYSLLMPGDYRYVEQYFKLGWTGGQVLPASIQICAAALTVVLALTMWLVSLRRRRRRRA